jgi:hypothetical protein
VCRDLQVHLRKSAATFLPSTTKDADTHHTAPNKHTPFRGPNRCGCCDLRAAWVRPRNRLRCSLRNRTQSGIIPGERMKTFWVYIMPDKSRRFSVGFTSNLGAEGRI